MKSVINKNIFLQLFFLFVLGSATVECQHVSDKANTNLKDTAIAHPYGYINDFENLFTKEEIEELEKIIVDFEKRTGHQIAIASIESIDSYTDFDQYALELSNSWGVGSAEKNDGMTIIFSHKLRNIRVSTGYGAEHFLTDSECKEVIDMFIIPQFKEGHYYEGIKTGLKELIKRWEQ